MRRDLPNILFIVMDTARAQTVLANENVLPNFHRIADSGVVFTNAYTTAPWTLPSHASMFTGQYTSNHGTHAGTKQFDPDVPTLAERLADAGYQTVAFSNNTWVSPDFGFDRGFESFDVGWKLFDGGADLATLSKEYDATRERARAVGKELFKRNGHRTLANGLYASFLRKRYDDGALATNWRLRRWLSKKRDSDRPFFLFVNYLEPHLKYEPPAKHCEPFLPDGVEYDEAKAINQDAWNYICGIEQMDDDDFDVLSSLYRGELAYLDHRIGAIYDHLAAENLLEDTIVVIAGDHGENIGEHCLMDHQYCLYDTLLHVPLLVRYPDEFSGGETCTELVELRDIYPTLLEAAGVDPPTEDGISKTTLQHVIDYEGRERVIGEYATPQPSLDDLESRTGHIPESVRAYDRGLRSVRTNRWKWIEGTDGSVELYDLEDDPDERRNVADENATRVERFRRLSTRELGPLRKEESSSSDAMKATTQKRLQDLGYL